MTSALFHPFTASLPASKLHFSTYVPVASGGGDGVARMFNLSPGHEAAGAPRADDGVVPAAAPHASLRAEPGVLYDGRGKHPLGAAKFHATTTAVSNVWRVYA